MLLVTWSICKQSLLFSNTHTFQKHFQTTFNTLKHFSKDKHLCIHSYKRESLQRLPKRWPFFKILSKPHKAPFQTIPKQSKWSKQVTKRPWKTMDEKGASTFPFHNLPPEPKNNLKGLSCAFLPFLLDKIKVGGDSC